MDVTIYPSKLSGVIRAPESKSQAHRLLIAAAMAGGCFVETGNMSDDIKATKRCLAALQEADPVQDAGAAQPAGGVSGLPVLECGESGSTLRFMLPLSVTYGCGAEFYGEGRLPERPLSPLDEQMAEHGVVIERAQAETAQVCVAPDSSANEGVRGRKIMTVSGRMRGGDFELPGNVSSQFLTGLLMALPLAQEDSRITITSPMESKAYVQMTLDVLKYFGIVILREEDTYYIKGNQRYAAPAPEIKVEGDWSNGAFWLVANEILKTRGGSVRVEGLDPASAQGDRKIARILEPTRGPVIVDASQVPDLVPIACVFGALREGTTVIENGARLRIKESDRIRTTCEMLSSLGADIHELEDGILVHGKKELDGGEVDGAGDHRIVMAAAVAALGCRGPVTVHGAEAAAKSYPGFFEDMKKLGGRIE